VFDEGRSVGYNTDVPGMINALDQAGTDRDRVRTAAVIGAGATARSAVAAIIERHAGRVPITAYARRPDQARELRALAESLGGVVDVGGWVEVADAMSADLVVSTLPGGIDLDVSPPASVGVLLDVAYDPWPTPLTSRWREAGGAVATGADLLLWQAIDQVELMTGRSAPIEAMRLALVAALDDRSNASV